MSWKKQDPALVASRELKRTLKAREEQKFMMRARLAKRDLDYAAAQVPVTVEERGGVRIETRGQRCIGSRCGAFNQSDIGRW